MALHHAHEQGILHRDVKPSNLLVDSSSWLWVADFGLARIAGEGDQTSTGCMMGTPHYMSPEQVIGSRKVVDHRTDVYSLGATLYELLTLLPAFSAGDRLELIVKIANAEPRRPRNVDPSIPRDLETIVLKAMAKDPADRYSSATDLADDLGRFLDGRPIHARPVSFLPRAAKWIHRRPMHAASGVPVRFTGRGVDRRDRLSRYLDPAPRSATGSGSYQGQRQRPAFSASLAGLSIAAAGPAFDNREVEAPPDDAAVDPTGSGCSRRRPDPR